MDFAKHMVGDDDVVQKDATTRHSILLTFVDDMVVVYTARLRAATSMHKNKVYVQNMVAIEFVKLLGVIDKTGIGDSVRCMAQPTYARKKDVFVSLDFMDYAEVI